MSTPNDSHIILDKELRRDIDAIIQRLKEGTGEVENKEWKEITAQSAAGTLKPGSYDKDSFIRRSRERSLTITKLQEAVMWLGMDLKAINDANPKKDAPPKTPLECAKDAYQRYGAVTDFKNFRGDPMPKFEDLGETITKAWTAAAFPLETGNPYPHSKDPSNTVIDKTADGLKL